MYQDIAHEMLLERMLSRVSEKFDKREGSVIWDTLSPTALELMAVYIELECVLNEAYGDTASREFLIRRCKERGIIPYPATNAVLKGEFTPADVDVIGKRFNIGQINYIVTEKLSDGEYQVRCETAGKLGNRQLGTMIPVEYIEGLETAELTELLIPGEDDEETEALRSRYFASFDEKAFGGNKRDYLDKTNALPGVGGVKVTRVWNSGISPSKMIPSDEVRTWYERISPELSGDPAAWLEAVYTAAEKRKLTTGGTVLLTIINSDHGVPSEMLIKTVQNTIDPTDGDGDGLAPIGHVVTVKGVQPVTVAVKSDITFEVGYSWTNLRDTVNSAIGDYFSELCAEWADMPNLTVRLSQIDSRLLSIKGIVDVTNTTLNGSRENITLGEYEIPIFGGVGE